MEKIKPDAERRADLVSAVIVTAIVGTSGLIKVLTQTGTENKAALSEAEKTYRCSLLIIEQFVSVMKLSYARGLLTSEDKEWKFLQQCGHIPQDEGRAMDACRNP